MMENNYDHIIEQANKRIHDLVSARDQLYRELEVMEDEIIHEEEKLLYWNQKRKDQNEQGT